MLQFFPTLPAQLDGPQRVSFLLRDAVPVGVVITEPAGENGLRVLADYVVPGYRDLQPGRFFYTQYAPSLREEGFTHFCAARGISMVALAIGWLLAQEPVTSVIAGATRPAQVVTNAAAALWTPSPEDLAELDEISPPPSKIALF